MNKKVEENFILINVIGVSVGLYLVYVYLNSKLNLFDLFTTISLFSIYFLMGLSIWINSENLLFVLHYVYVLVNMFSLFVKNNLLNILFLMTFIGLKLLWDIGDGCILGEHFSDNIDKDVMKKTMDVGILIYIVIISFRIGNNYR
jgi:hypothetical protein